MRALKYMGPGKLELVEVDKPKLEEGQVLVEVKACGICGSDVHGYLGLTGRRTPPMTMGHEFSGKVAEVYPGEDESVVGTDVIVQPINFCGTCRNCKKGLTNMCLNKRFFGVLEENGAMQEYLAVPRKLLYPMPEGLSYDIGALAEPFAVAYGSIKKAGSLEGKNLLIVGAGTIGICILQIAKLQNPKKIIVSDLSGKRLDRAKELGADEVVNPSKEDYMEAVTRITEGEMIDISIEAVGVQATANQSVKVLTVGGTSVWVGMSQKEMEINMQDIVCSARSVLGSFNYTHQEFGEVVKLLGSGKMEAGKLISAVTDLEHGLQAFQDLHEKPDDLLKIIIHPGEGA